MQTTDIDAMFSSVANCFNREALENVIALRATPEESSRIEWLGERASEGELTEAEREEYRSAVMFANFLGILQSKARKRLADAN